MIIYFLKKLKFIINNTSYSQCGEDSIVRYLFNDMNQKTINYLDLGTNKPDFGNNTYWFYTKNHYGVCVEANPVLCKIIKKKRRRDIVINAGVSTSNKKSAKFYIFNEPAISTFDETEALKRSMSGKYKLLDNTEVPLININDLIKSNFETFPDFLSIDIEGLDLDVLKSLNYETFPIPVICVESCLYSENHIRPKDYTIIEFLESKGYEIYADTYINTIFVNKEWFYKIYSK